MGGSIVATVSAISIKPIVYYLLIMAIVDHTYGFPSPPQDDRYLDREYASPGGHQLASWIVSQLRREDEIPSVEVPALPYRLPIFAGKRNSELTSSIMGIPRTMINNGRKK